MLKILAQERVKAGKTVSTGYSGEYLTAPDAGEQETYTLVEKVYAESYTHAGWEWIKE